jgi:type IV pilus assembly protein PilX
MPPLAQHSARPRQQGAVLVVSLVLLLILTMIGVTIARMQTVEERMSRNEHNRNLAMQASEAALRSAEAAVLDAIYVNFAQNANGLYTLVPASGSIVDQLMSGAVTASSSTVLTYGGPTLGDVPLAQQPQLVVESLPPVAMPGDNLGQVGAANNPVPPVKIYRVTARAVGGDGTATVTLQSVYR